MKDGKIERRYENTTSPEELDKAELRLKKEQLKQEKKSMELGTYELDRLEKAYNRGLKELEMDKEMQELIIKLYPIHGSKYTETQEWKDFMVKSTEFILKQLDNKKEAMDEGYKMKRNDILSHNSERERICKELKSRVIGLKRLIKNQKKDKDKMYR